MNASTKLDLNMTHSEASNTLILPLFVPSTSTHFLTFMAGIRCLARVLQCYNVSSGSGSFVPVVSLALPISMLCFCYVPSCSR